MHPPPPLMRELASGRQDSGRGRAAWSLKSAAVGTAATPKEARSHGVAPPLGGRLRLAPFKEGGIRVMQSGSEACAYPASPCSFLLEGSEGTWKWQCETEIQPSFPSPSHCDPRSCPHRQEDIVARPHQPQTGVARASHRAPPKRLAFEFDRPEAAHCCKWRVWVQTGLVQISLGLTPALFKFGMQSDSHIRF
jgi:hypothetical protein